MTEKPTQEDWETFLGVIVHVENEELAQAITNAMDQNYAIDLAIKILQVANDAIN